MCSHRRTPIEWVAIHHVPSLLQTHWMFKPCCSKLYIQMEEDSVLQRRRSRGGKLKGQLASSDAGEGTHVQSSIVIIREILARTIVRCPLCCEGILSASSPQLHPPVQHQPCLPSAATTAAPSTVAVTRPSSVARIVLAACRRTRRSSGFRSATWWMPPPREICAKPVCTPASCSPSST